MGYCFINLLNPNDIKQFYQTFHDKKWELFKSRKVSLIINRFVKLNTQEYKENKS